MIRVASGTKKRVDVALPCAILFACFNIFRTGWDSCISKGGSGMYTWETSILHGGCVLYRIGKQQSELFQNSSGILEFASDLHKNEPKISISDMLFCRLVSRFSRWTKLVLLEKSNKRVKSNRNNFQRCMAQEKTVRHDSRMCVIFSKQRSRLQKRVLGLVFCWYISWLLAFCLRTSPP